jgi:serine/threonine-protein kinase
VRHRDINPGNFLLSGPIGPDERVLLDDFGIARPFDDVGPSATGSVMVAVSGRYTIKTAARQLGSA